MTPGAPLLDPVFRTYLKIMAAVLGLAGGALGCLGWGLRKDLGSIWTTYRAWLVMVPLFMLMVLMGRPALVVFFTSLSVFAFKEWARATGLYRDWLLTGMAYLGMGLVGLSCLAGGTRGGEGWYGAFTALPLILTVAILLVPIFRNRAKGQLQMTALAILGFIYIGWMFGHLAFLATCPGATGHLLYLVFAVELSDVAAFTFGRLFGRHPLRSVISPNKTWEGALGALLVSLALPWALRFSFPHFGPWQLLATGLIVGIGGQMGDLSISYIKRDLGIKDMGASIPGHGGVLDRIDSLIFVAPLFLHLVRCCP